MSSPTPESIPRISVIIPVLNEAEQLNRLLPLLSGTDGLQEILVVDGGSCDGSDEAVAAFPDVVRLHAEQGRGRQLNAGAAQAAGEILLFLHADTTLPPGWQRAVRDALADRRTVLGAFRFALDSPGWPARLLELGVWCRCRWCKQPYGDQAFFLRRDDFQAVGGFPDWPLLEDVELVRRLKSRGRVRTLALPAITSARRWARHGFLRQTLLNRSILRQYRRGVPVEQLARQYRRQESAVVIFCKYPEPGTVKTRLAASIGDDQAVPVYRSMVTHTLEVVADSRESSASLVFYAPARDGERVAGWLGPDRMYVPQVEGDLGDRMLAAFAHAFAEGFARVVIIGTDCPGLQARHLDEAIRSLRRRQLVLGPTPDGGYYLIGARASHPALFRSMPWSTPEVLPETRRRIAAAGIDCHELEPLSDVDTAEDLDSYDLPWLNAVSGA